MNTDSEKTLNRRKLRKRRDAGGANRHVFMEDQAETRILSKRHECRAPRKGKVAGLDGCSGEAGMACIYMKNRACNGGGASLGSHLFFEDAGNGGRD
jgi:hypothetical protein